MDTFVLVVAPGQPLPTPGENFKVESVLTEEKCTLHVKRIDGLRWHSKNNTIIIEVVGTLKGVKNGPKAASPKQ